MRSLLVMAIVATGGCEPGAAMTPPTGGRAAQSSAERCEVGGALGLLMTGDPDGGRPVRAADFVRELGPLGGVRVLDYGADVLVLVKGAPGDEVDAIADRKRRALDTARVLGMEFAVEDLVRVSEDCGVRWDHPRSR